MKKSLLNSNIQLFISKNLATDIVSLLLRKSPFEGVTSQELALQIESKKKCTTKLPTWFHTPKIFYPKKLHIEQTSSEITAHYKSELVSGKSLVDLTGGLGIDAYFYSKKIQTVFHCEMNSELAEIAAYNFKVLGVKNIVSYTGDGLTFLRDSTERFDWLYLDPSRRDEKKGKVFRLSDCQPNCVEHLDLLFKKTNTILIKTAPLLDISMGISELRDVKEIHIVGINGDVKEVLWLLEKNYEGAIAIKTANYHKTAWQVFSFFRNQEKAALATFNLPQEYLYEPNATILKSGGFKSIGVQLGLSKIHKNTHLYTSNELVDFPGRRFTVQHVFPYTKETGKRLKNIKANITTRNFPLTVQALRKKHAIKDGGSLFVFFATDHLDNLIVLQCEKIN